MDRIRSSKCFGRFLAAWPRAMPKDLMSYPFFSLAKSKRVHPIDFETGEVTVHVEATAERGLARIWDADVLTLLERAFPDKEGDA
jgi:plasmid replication initiation protein